jgi:16S rRNA (cytosine967-C5)-methyltransferase
MPAEARICAFAVLRRVFERGAYADRALRSEAHHLDARDRALAMRLAYGAIQRRGTLDHVLTRLCTRPLDRLHPPVLAALRLGLYELLYTSGAPPHAIVADAVELAKTPRGAGHALVNAVLRRAVRESHALLSELTDDTPAHAAVMHSHPEWLAHQWWAELTPHHARALMSSDNHPSELALRVNTLRASPASLARELGVPTRTDPELPEALLLDGPFDLHASPAHRSGALIAQSRAAMLVAHALDPHPGERVLDLCAAPGGKSTHIAALMGDVGEIVAVERLPTRAARLRDTAQRLGIRSIRVELADAALPRPEAAAFDRVLVDPPCSGLGTLQAHPDLRWRVTPERIPELARTQAAILAAAAHALRPGGVLVYSTCTISAAENELQIERFLARHPHFALDDLTNEQQIHTHPRAPNFLLTMPHRERTAGFFVARMRRAGGPSAVRL